MADQQSRKWSTSNGAIFNVFERPRTRRAAENRATHRVIEYFAVTQGHSRSFEMTPLTSACVSPY